MPLTREQYEEVFSEVSTGKSVASALEKRKVNFRSFYEGMEKDKELAECYTRARRHQAESGQGRILQVVDGVLSGDIDPNAGRVAIDALKWNAARMHPAIYGDNQKVEHSGPAGGPITVSWQAGAPSPPK